MQGYTYKNIFILLQNWEHGKHPGNESSSNYSTFIQWEATGQLEWWCEFTFIEMS